MDAESKIRILISSALSAKGFNDATASTERLKQKSKEASRGIGGINDSLDVLKSRAQSVVQPLHTLQGIFAAYGVGTVVKSLIDVNAEHERMQTGIAALIAVNAQNETSTGRNVTAAEKFALAQKMAAAAVEELRKANVDTPANLAQLTDGFQSAIGPALKLNWTIDQTIKYTTLMTQAAAAMGMPMNQLAQEMRSVLSGQIDMNSQVARNLGITNEQIALHIKMGDTYDFLLTKLQDFEEAGKKIRTDWDGVTSDLEDRFASIRKATGNKLFEELKIDLAEVSTLLEKNTDQIAGEFSSALMSIYTNGKKIGEGLYEMRGILDNVVVGYAAFRVGGMIATGMATATTAIVAMNTALKTATIAQLAFNAAARVNPYILGATVLGSVAYAAYESGQEMQAQAEANSKYWEDIAKENTEKAKTQEGMLKTAESYELKYQEIFEKTGQRIEAYKTQAEQLRKMAASAGGATQEKLKFGGAATLSDEDSKKQTLESLKTYEDFYKSTGDLSTAWASKEAEIRIKNTTLSEAQLQKLLAAEKQEYMDSAKITKDRKKLQEDYYDYIADLTKSSTENKVDQEVLSEAYKYQKFLDTHKSTLEEKKALERAFMGTIERIQLDGQKESLKKQQDALLEYYKSTGDTTKAGEIELARYKETLKESKLSEVQQEELYNVAKRDNERKILLERLDFNEEYYKAVGDMANANAIAQEKYALQLEKQGYSKDKISNMAYGSQSQKSNYDTMYSSVGIDTGLAGQMAERLKAIDTFQATERSRVEAHYALLEQTKENHETKMSELDAMQFQSSLATASTGFNSLASLSKMFYDASDGQNKIALRAYQAFSVAQAMINTYTAASKALATGGPYMGPAMAAIAVAQGMAQVAMIKAQKFHSGGFVTGTTDEVPAILQREEGVLSRKGMKNLDALNLGTASSSSSGSQQITIVNSIDPAIMEQYVTSRSGRKVIKNIINGG